MPRPPGRRRNSHPPDDPDREFGVPFPGTVLPPAQWAQTALKATPEPIDWLVLFGRTAPVVLDLGCGNGRYSISSALLRPTHDHLGVDTLPVVVRYARKRGNQRGCANLRFAVLGGHDLFVRHVPPGSVSEVHCYHPQPYHDPKDVHRRLVTPEFLALVRHALAPDGTFTVQTDSADYWRAIRSAAAGVLDLVEHPAHWPDSPHGRTRREIYALKKGLKVFRGVARNADCGVQNTE